jgi:undecaprenyl-diphosphatase
MDIFTGIFLGIVQGLTEFLPISSSGHLVLFQNLLGFKEPELLLDVGLHFGTLLAVCIFLRKDLQLMIRESWQTSLAFFHDRETFKQLSSRPHPRLAFWVVIGTMPTVFIGFAFRSHFERLFASLDAVGMMLIFTGLILIISRFLPRQYTSRNHFGLWIALMVGVSQGLAIIPGISRSGTTIICGLILGLDRDLAARFSFLLSIPAIIGALLLQIFSEGIEGLELGTLSFGFLASAVVGFIAIKILVNMVRKGSLYIFTPYCCALGLVIIFFL